MAACVDQRGEAWDQAVWLLKNDQHDADSEGSGLGGGGAAPAPASTSGGGSSEEALAVRKVWDFLLGFAKRADIDWRVVISRLGVMEEAEFTGLIFLFPSRPPLTQFVCSLDNTLTYCSSWQRPWHNTRFAYLRGSG